MKHNDIKDVSYKLTYENYENVFPVEIDDSNYYFYNILSVVNFPQSLDPTKYSEYTVLTNDTWPLIAWKFYGSVKLWWVVCGANQIVNPVEHPVPGTKLKIINTNQLKTLLNHIIGVK